MTIKTVCAATLLLLAADAWAQPAPGDPAGFSAQFADTVRRDAGSIPVAVKAPLVLSVGGADISLARLFGFCQAQAAGCGEATVQYAAGILKAVRERNAPIDAANVRLVLRPAQYVAQMQASASPTGPKLVARPFVAGWSVVPVLDTSTATRSLTTADLAALGMDEDAVFQRAGANLAAAMPPLASVAKPAGPGQIGHFGGDIYDVSRVALHRQWAALAAAQGGVLVVAMPTIDRVIYVSETTPYALDALRTLSRDSAAKSAYPFAPSLLLRWTEAAWVPVP